MVNRLTDEQRTNVERLFKDVVRLCAEFDIDPAEPEALERLVLALAERRKPVAPPPGPGAPYRSAMKDWMIVEMISYELANLRNSGLKPTIRSAARRLTAWPFFLDGMSAETIRNRHAKILRRWRRGEPLQPELKKLMDQLSASKVDAIRRQARARQDEK